MKRNIFRGTERHFGDLRWLLKERPHLSLGVHISNGKRYPARPLGKPHWRRQPDGRWSVEQAFTTADAKVPA